MASMSLRTPAVITKEVTGTSFGFYSADQVKQISVKRITNPLLFDPLNNAVPGGLYDPAMGPTENHQSCATCKQGYHHCPGHFGHVELCVPVYNPLVFTTVLKLMKCVCFNCHSVRMPSERVKRFAQKLQLLHQGRVTEALAVNTDSAFKPPKLEKGGDEVDWLFGAQPGDAAGKDVDAERRRKDPKMSSQSLMLQQQLIRG